MKIVYMHVLYTLDLYYNKLLRTVIYYEKLGKRAL